MNSARRLGPALLALSLLPLGCGSSETTTVNNVMVPPAQQRADLQRARDLGIISGAEYLEAVQQIGR